MKKNVASQIVGAQLNSRTDGSPVTTGTTTVYVTGDGGVQATGTVGSGAATHEGQGFWTYAPAQAETNYDHVAFTFGNTSAVHATIQAWPSFPQTGDNFARLGAPAGASVSADIAAVKVDTAATLVDTAEIGAAGAGLTVLATAAALTTVDTVVDAIKVKTDFLPSATAGAAGGVFIAGTNAATAVTTSFTTTFTGNLTGSVGSVTGAVGSVTGSVGSVTGAVGSVTGAVGSVTGAVGSVTGNVGGNVTGSVGSVATGGIAAASFAAGAIDAAAIAADAIGSSELAASAVAEIADQVWDELLSGHVVAGSAGEALAAAGTAGDPWTTALPGAYGAGTAGKIVGDNINATISSRATQTSVDDVPTNAEFNARTIAAADYATAANLATVDTVVDSILLDTAEIGAAGAGLTALATAAALTTVDTVVDAIKAKTDSLTFGVAGQVDANIQSVNDSALQGDGTVGTNEWRKV